jgi:hydroxyacylglutathione hydrolase
VRDVYMQLDDGVIIYPCHAAGSECGPDIGDRLSSTVGYERRFNPYCQIEKLEDFRRALQENAPPVPTHYPRMKKVNAAGPPVVGSLPSVPALMVDVFAETIEGGDAQLLDTRDMLAFGGGHISGALNIGARPDISVWAGWLLDPERPILLVLENDRDLARVVTLLRRTGFTRFAGYLAGGMAAWQESGRELEQIDQMTVHGLKKAGPGLTPLDVRKPEEWDAGHVPGAEHAFLGELRQRLDELDPSRTYATYCASGYRASVAASVLARNGFRNVRNVPGSWKAWASAGYKTTAD